MSAGNHHGQKGKGDVRVLQEDRGDMPFEVVDSADRDAVPHMEAQSKAYADQQRTGKAGAVGHGD